MLELYENIRKYRKDKNMTQGELAKKTGYTDRSSIAKIERGDVDLPQSKILLFASALDVAPGELMGDSGVMESRPLHPDEQQLLDNYNSLNDYGKEEARKRIKELSQIDDYKKVPTAGNRITAG